MQENLNRFDTLKLATQYWQGDSTTTTLIAVIFFLALVIFLLGGFLLQKKFKERNIRRFFESFAKERELTDQEIEILWEYAHKMERDPMLVLEFKAPFEKVVDLYIQTDPEADESLVQDMRKKLGFEVQSPYVPIVTTKDIEIFQNGRMIFANNKAVDVALYDKDERTMSWLVVDSDLPLSIHPGEVVKVVFVRQEDGIYTFEQPIAQIVKEGGKIIVKIPHTFDLNRIQRREYPRIKTDMPAKVIYQGSDERLSAEARLMDLSAGGARVCIQKDLDKFKKIKYSDELTIVFVLGEKRFEIEAKVLERDIKPKMICFRTLFEKIDDKIKDDILEYVQKEQLKAAQLRRNR